MTEDQMAVAFMRLAWSRSLDSERRVTYAEFIQRQIDRQRALRGDGARETGPSGPEHRSRTLSGSGFRTRGQEAA